MHKRKMRRRVLICVAVFVVAVSGVVAISHHAFSKQEVIPEEPEILSVIRENAPASLLMVEEEPAQDIWNDTLSQEEIDLIALVTMGEAEGEPELGKRLVIDTILNRVDDPHFPNTVTDVIYQPHQFTAMWNGRIKKCEVRPEYVQLVKEELKHRVDYKSVFFMAGQYSKYGKPLFFVNNHYFSSYE